eukprot:scaffold103073_cov41-Tisochrysis_lutea.AAC.1
MHVALALGGLCVRVARSLGAPRHANQRPIKCVYVQFGTPRGTPGCVVHGCGIEYEKNRGGE